MRDVMELLSDMLQAVNPSHREVCEIMVLTLIITLNRGVKSIPFFFLNCL